MPVVPCATIAPVFGLVQFSATEFLASYPEFTGINIANPSVLATNFASATLMLNNSCCSRVSDANTRLLLLYLLTAHITAILQGSNDYGVGAPATSLVGSVTAASPGVLTVTAAVGALLAVGTLLYDGPSVGGSFLPLGAAIASIVSGTGGIGVYTLNVPVTPLIASESMIVTGVPNVIQPLGVVGRISDASEGDVSVSSEWNAPPNGSMAYYIQTRYGAQYWTMTAKFRTAVFVPAPAASYSPFGGYGYGPWAPGGPYGQ